MSSKLPEMALLLMRLIGQEAALLMMEPSAYGGKRFVVPKGEVGRGEQAFAALADVVGTSNATQICRQFGGGSIYIPLLDQMHRDQRNQSIVDAYAKGAKVWEIATKHQISMRQVWNILKSTDASEQTRQESLF